MKVTWRTEWPHALLITAMFVLAAATWSVAPDRIPVHWNIAGQVDRWGGRFEGLFALPLVAVAVYLVMIVLPRFDPGRANYDAFAGPYASLRLGVLAVLAAIHAFVLLWVRGVPVRIGVFAPLVFGALFVVIGNLLGKIRPNWFVGIRTPWTLSSKLAWSHTHRAGGWLFIVLGVLSMACAVVRSSWAMWIMIGAGAVGLLGLLVYSYVVWRRDPDKTPPAGTQPAG
jgi:uncharacterized membrane protein